jgi:hypothetical protein
VFSASARNRFHPIFLFKLLDSITILLYILTEHAAVRQRLFPPLKDTLVESGSNISALLVETGSIAACNDGPIRRSVRLVYVHSISQAALIEFSALHAKNFKLSVVI